MEIVEAAGLAVVAVSVLGGVVVILSRVEGSVEVPGVEDDTVNI